MPHRAHRHVLRRGRIGAAVLAACGALLLAGCFQIPVTPVFDTAEPDGDFTDFSEQEPIWTDCGDAVVCADVFAPLDWDDPDGERITLRLVKHPAEGGEPIGTLFVNPGGPGASGADYVADGYEYAASEAVREQYDLIGWDPRGVGQSSAVVCLDDAGMDEFLYGTGDPEADGHLLDYGSDAWIDESIDANAEFGEACLAGTGELLAHVDTASTVRDLEMLRGIVGDEQLNYLGYSYGTQIGSLYADLFPDTVGHLVLDGAMDPSVSYAEVAAGQAVGMENALRAYTADCIERSDCPLREWGATTVDEGMDRIAQLLADAEADPIRASDGRLLYDGTLFTAIIAPLYSQTMWPQLDTILEEVARGNVEPAFQMADYYNDRVDGVYQTNLMEAFTAISCVSSSRSETRDYDAWRADAAAISELAPVTGRYLSFGQTGCFDWPVPPADNATRAVTGSGADPLLVIGTTGDPATPYAWAESLSEQLESAILVTFEGEGHTAYGKSACVTDIVDAYFLEGEVPAAGAAVCTS